MDVRLLAHRAPRLDPNLLAEVQERVHECRGDRRKRQAVCECKGRREEERTVAFVQRHIERRVRVDDPCHIVRLSETIEGCTRGDTVCTVMSNARESTSVELTA